MTLRPAFTLLRRFWKQECGTAAMETVVMFPFLFMGLTFSYEYFDMFRYQSVREKATYTVADMLSRETSEVDQTYMDNVKTLFDIMTNDEGNNQVRVTVIRYHLDAANNIDEFELRWSEVRGTGDLNPLSANDVRTAHATLPRMINGQEIILVETSSQYDPVFSTGFTDGTNIKTRMFVPLRFAAQLCYDGVCDAA
ncbi:MAG: TadE/TadG family type IV pilus assembly protein [Roseovarius sp.]|jgi:Flp pilus assembly protein TadG|uniref:TadE/TadG family type IV pilus assembly protein n=1 Tax=Roseovarius sp. TaxID=1486281 RepID=UPI002607E55C|nr:TadE/TadG family type IV pilus assembly protein [Roseovarius sp.]